jgi:hypothetical protein
MNETEYLKQGANGRKLKESIKQLNMENKIKEIERLFIVHDDLTDKKKKIERLIKENFSTTIDLGEQKRRYEKLIEGNLEVIKVLTKKQK